MKMHRVSRPRFDIETRPTSVQKTTILLAPGNRFDDSMPRYRVPRNIEEPIKSSMLVQRFANEFTGAACRLLIRSIEYTASRVIG